MMDNEDSPDNITGICSQCGELETLVHGVCQSCALAPDAVDEFREMIGYCLLDIKRHEEAIRSCRELIAHYQAELIAIDAGEKALPAVSVTDADLGEE